MSSPSSSVAQPEKCNDINVAVEESKEKVRENTNPRLGSDPQEVMSERMSENPSLGYGAVPRGNAIMQRYPSDSNKKFVCRFCCKWFSSTQGLGGHMNAHKKELHWEKKRIEMEKDFHRQWILRRYSQDALSNDNHLIGLGPFKRRCSGLYPSFNTGLTDMNVVPRMAPTRFFTGKTFTNGSSSSGLGLVPPYNSNPPIFPRDSHMQENVLKEEDVILKLGNDNNVEIDDDDDDHPEEGPSKSWGADLSL